MCRQTQRQTQRQAQRQTQRQTQQRITCALSGKQRKLTSRSCNIDSSNADEGGPAPKLNYTRTETVS